MSWRQLVSPTDRRTTTQLPGIGAGGQKDLNLRAAVTECVKAGKDSQRFANESEVVLNTFDKALRSVLFERYIDEQEIIDGVPDKEAFVKFLLDCVQSRFLLWFKVVGIKKRLTAKSKLWGAAFDKVSRTPPYDSVDLRQPPGAPQPSPPPARFKLPIPFCLEMFAVFAILFPLLTLVPSWSGFTRWTAFCVGLALCSPCVIFELLTWCAQDWLLASLICGKYAVLTGDDKHTLGWLWWPSTRFVTKYEGPLSCVSFGQWFPCPQAAEGASIEIGAGGCRMNSTLLSASTSVGSSHESSRVIESAVLVVECASLMWSGKQASLCAGGALEGLPMPAIFDGDAIELSSEFSEEPPQTWVKLSFWRMEWIRKMLLSMFTLGLTFSCSSALVTPFLTWPSSAVELQPIVVVFLLDSSGSLSAAMWKQEQDAAKIIVDAFVRAFNGDPKDLHIGITQFSNKVEVSVPLTNDLRGKVYPFLPPAKGLKQKLGETDYEIALRSCTNQSRSYLGAVDPYRVCVLITDGEPNAGESDPYKLRSMVLRADMQVMGIYIGGSSPPAEATLQLIACGVANACPWYSSAVNYDFAKLKANSFRIASLVTNGLEASDYPASPSWPPAFVALVLPLTCWWIYLRCGRRRKVCVSKAMSKSGGHADANRLRVASSALEMTTIEPESTPEPSRRRSFIRFPWSKDSRTTRSW